MTLTLSDWCLLIGTVAAIIAAFYAVLAYHRPRGQPVDKPQNASVAPSRGRSIIPIALALVAWAAVAFGYYDQHWRSYELSDLFRNSLQGSPLGWSTIFLDRADVNDPPNVRNVSLTGGNVSEEEIRLDDAYLLSGISGDRLDLKVIWGGKA